MRRILAACLVLLPLVSLPASACSWGDPVRRLQDEIRGYYDADVVFLAKIGEVTERPPLGQERFWMSIAKYSVLEVYRGNPARDGVVASEASMKAGADGVPPDSCTGGAIPAGSRGAVMLIFANKRDRPGFSDYYKIDRFDTTRVDNCEGCDDVLQRVRLYGKAEQVSPQ